MIAIPYGDTYLSLDTEKWKDKFQRIEVLEPKDSQGHPNPLQEVDKALQELLGFSSLDHLQGKRSIAIVISDITRPNPNQLLLDPLLKRLHLLGIPEDCITIIVATGKHRIMTREDMIKLVGLEILGKYQVVSHDANNMEEHTYLGKTSYGTPLYIDRRFVEAEGRIITGMVEPHQFVGFTGGYKSITIGLGHEETIGANHFFLTDENSRLGEIKDNKARKDIDEVADFLDVHLTLNVVLNNEKQIVRAFAGKGEDVHQKAVALVLETAIRDVDRPFDCVIASPGGFPKDIDLYQAQKGLAHASFVLKEGGTLILVAECQEGPGEDLFALWMKTARSPLEIVERFHREGFQMGAHKAFLLARTLLKANVILVSEAFSTSMAQEFFLTPYHRIDDAIENTLKGYQKKPELLVLPRASSTIPRCKGNGY